MDRQALAAMLSPASLSALKAARRNQRRPFCLILSMTDRGVLIALAVGSLAACAPTAGVIDPQAPYRTPASGSDAEVVFYDYTTASDGPATLSITFDDGRGPRTVGRDLRPREFGFASSPIYPTRNNGTLRVSVTLTRNGQAAATETIELPLKTDWRWGVGVHADTNNPLEPCIGCMGVEFTPIAPSVRRAEGESLYLVWSGNSIRNPGVY